jgi:AcrR family transcriptional regulator
MPRRASKETSKVIDWDVIRRDFVVTGMGLPELAAKHKISKSAIYRMWKKEKEQWERERTEWVLSVRAHAEEKAFADQVDARLRIYDATRQAADSIIEKLLQAASDADAVFRHVVQIEEEEEIQQPKGGRRRTRKKWAEGRVLEVVNGRNASDLARAIKDLVTTVRQLDGIMDVKDKAKLDLDRERLALQVRTAGMDDDRESESGIAIVPAVDASLLDTALPDPGEIHAESPPEPSV